ncbi:MAG TPA: peptidylprolyl isomerase [Chthoniobacterales bacterium]|jgi:cyclophilin family peptidyl-prolyl cis-trans isomerase
MFSARSLFLTLITFLPLASFAQNIPPQVSTPIGDATLLLNASAEVVPLTEHFIDPDTSGVRLTTTLGPIDIALYDQRTPATVANFKNYVDSGRYFITDPTTNQIAPLFWHRSVPGFVIQSGGFLATVDPSNSTDVAPTQVQAFAAVPNEPGISNERGTIAMAKLGTDPNSATSQWYINLADNGGPPSNLDTVDGGFTVFGRVLGDGMTVADAIAAVPTFNFGTPFDSLPVRNYTSGLPTPGNLITNPAIDYISSLTFTASSDHPAIASVQFSGSDLLVSGKQIGSATITVTATDVDGAQVSQAFAVTVVANPVHLANISTRAVVGGGDNALIGGFIVRGDTPKRLILRAIGPSLAASAGLTNVLANPVLEVHDGTGTLIASNDNWQDDPNSQEVTEAGIAPADPNESAIVLTLPASSDGLGYTALARGADGGSGVGLVEVYDVDSSPGSSVLNISTRSDVQTGDDVLIGGFIVFGAGSQDVLVRAIGPSLAAAGVTDSLGDPTLTLYNAQGTQIDFNDDWQDNPAKDQIEATTIPPGDPKESAVLDTLAPGSYTAIVRGAANATGTGLVEVYALANP